MCSPGKAIRVITQTLGCTWNQFTMQCVAQQGQMQRLGVLSLNAEILSEISNAGLMLCLQAPVRQHAAGDPATARPKGESTRGNARIA